MVEREDREREDALDVEENGEMVERGEREDA